MSPLAHTPCERRVDGERVTELIPAREWLSRQDKNALVSNERNEMPPALPRYSSRDHLHDRNRELCVFDPANPGLQTYIRVTRRRNPDRNVERALYAKRQDRILQQSVIEEIEGERANELLELRSANIRNLLKARSQMQWTGAPMRPIGAPAAAPSAAERQRRTRINELESEMRRIKATYEYKGYSQQSAPAPAPVAPRMSRTALRGGCWPVEQMPFRPATTGSLEA